MNYSGVQAVFMAFFSKDIYRAVVTQWKGLAYLYLFSLIVSTLLVVGMVFHFKLQGVASGIATPMVNEMPVMTLTQGKLKIDKPSPYQIKDKSTGNPIVTFDTDDNITEVPGETGVLVTSSKLIIKSPTREEVRDLSDLPDFELTPEMINSSIKAFLNYFVPVLFGVVLLPFFSFLCAIQSLVYAAIGLGFAKITRTKITYGESVRIAVLAMSPIILIHGVLSLVQFSMNGFLWNVVAMLVTIGYLYFGVWANSPEQSPERYATSMTTPPQDPPMPTL